MIRMPPYAYTPYRTRAIETATLTATFRFHAYISIRSVAMSKVRTIRIRTSYIVVARFDLNFSISLSGCALACQLMPAIASRRSCRRVGSIDRELAPDEDRASVSKLRVNQI